MDTPKQRKFSALGGPALVASLAVAKVALHLVLVGRYGYFRDELYYLACADHLAWGYVDHPPLSIFMLAGVRAALGESLLALRLVPALAGGLTVLLSGLVARELGGGRLAQVLAALATLVAPIGLAMSSYYSMNSLDLVLWPLLALLLVRMIRRDEPRLWLAIGLVAGLATLNKLAFVVPGAALLLALALTPHRRWFRGSWLYLGLAVAAAVVAPHLIWQQLEGWPFLEFAGQAAAHKMVRAGPLEYLLSQILLNGPLGVLLALAGLVHLIADRPHRVLGLVFVLVVVGFYALGGKSYYAAPAYPMMLAAGAVAVERVARPGPRVALRVGLPVLLLASGVLIAPMAMPVLSPGSYVGYARAVGLQAPRDERGELGQLPQHFADRFGWPEMVATVARVHRSLPPAERRRCGIVASNYGEAGAIDLFGPSHGLPAAASPHNAYWGWGPGDLTGEVVIVIGYPRARLEALFDRVEQRAVIRHAWAMPYETELPVFVCRGLQVPVTRLWERLRRYV
jgi:hypothetical protein